VTTGIIETAQEQRAETRSPRTLPAPGPLPKAGRHDPAKQQAAAIPTIPINEGSIFVANGILSPITLKSRSFTEGWRLVEDKRPWDIEGELREKAWHLFCLVPDVQGAGIARSPDRAVRKALEEVFAKALLNRVNAVEIAALKTKRVLGIYRTAVAAKLRHIQESPYLFTTTEEMNQRVPVTITGPDWTAEPWSQIPGVPKPFLETRKNRKEMNHVEHNDYGKTQIFPGTQS
jgi:hypothetical protein